MSFAGIGLTNSWSLYCIDHNKSERESESDDRRDECESDEFLDREAIIISSHQIGSSHKTESEEWSEYRIHPELDRSHEEHSSKSESEKSEYSKHDRTHDRSMDKLYCSVCDIESIFDFSDFFEFEYRVSVYDEWSVHTSCLLEKIFWRKTSRTRSNYLTTICLSIFSARSCIVYNYYCWNGWFSKPCRVICTDSFIWNCHH